MKIQKNGFTLVEFVVCILVFTALATLGNYLKSHYRHSAEMASFLTFSTPIRNKVDESLQKK